MARSSPSAAAPSVVLSVASSGSSSEGIAGSTTCAAPTPRRASHSAPLACSYSQARSTTSVLPATSPMAALRASAQAATSIGACWNTSSVGKRDGGDRQLLPK